MERLWRGVWIVAGLFWALPVGATTLLGLDLSALSQRSDSVVRGKVQDVQSRWSGDGKRIVTDVRVEVAESLKGEPAQTVTVTQPGGRVGDIGQRVDGIAAFQPGEEVVLFLERHGGTRFQLTGMAQGKYRLQRSADGRETFAIPELLKETRVIDPLTRQPLQQALRSPLSLEELRRQVRAAPLKQKPGSQTTPVPAPQQKTGTTP
jgi:hypothetical protein